MEILADSEDRAGKRCFVEHLAGVKNCRASASHAFDLGTRKHLQAHGDMRA